jgi:hypothetical protein
MRRGERHYAIFIFECAAQATSLFSGAIRTIRHYYYVLFHYLYYFAAAPFSPLAITAKMLIFIVTTLFSHAALRIRAGGRLFISMMRIAIITSAEIFSFRRCHFHLEEKRELICAVVYFYAEERVGEREKDAAE